MSIATTPFHYLDIVELRERMLERIHQEFRCSSFSFNYDRPLEFAVWSWSKPDRVCGYYVAYRWILAAFSLSALVASGALFTYTPGYWFIYLTDLGFLVQGIHLIVSAVVPVEFLLISQNKEVKPKMTSLTKLSWFLYNATTLTTFVITVAYWALLFTPGSRFGPINFIFHGANSIVSMLDLFISKRPYRILHFFHPLVFLLAYVAFTSIYWAAGGRNYEIYGIPYVYYFTNWDNLKVTIPFVVVGLFVVLPLVHVFLWGLHLLRDSLCGCGNTQTRITAADEGQVNPVYSDEMYS